MTQPTYAAYNGKFFIWACHGNDKDCCNSYVPSTFYNIDSVKRLIDRNDPDGFYPILCEGFNPVRKNGEFVRVS